MIMTSLIRHYMLERYQVVLFRINIVPNITAVDFEIRNLADKPSAIYQIKQNFKAFRKSNKYRNKCQSIPWFKHKH